MEESNLKEFSSISRLLLDFIAAMDVDLLMINFESCLSLWFLSLMFLSLELCFRLKLLATFGDFLIYVVLWGFLG